MATLFQVPQFFDSAGNPLSGGTIDWYAAGTAVYKDTWQDQAETTPHTNPIILTTDGRAPGGAIFIRGSYKLILKDSAGNVICTIDDINEYDSYDFTGLTASIADLNSTTTTAKSVSGTYNVILTDRGKTLMADASTGNVIINLLAAVTAGDTFKIGIKKIDSSINTVTIIPSGIQTIDGGANKVLYDPQDYIQIHCDGSNNKILGSLIRGTLKTVSSVTTVGIEDSGLIYNCDASGGTFNINLPACVTVGRGFAVGFKKTDNSVNSITLVTNGTETIDGKSSYFIHFENQFTYIKTDGVNWYVFNESGSASEFTTGDVKPTYNGTQNGWVQMNDGSIGNAASGATTRANADTQDLYVLLWTNVGVTYCPMDDGNPYGASALDDFNANRAMRLTKTLGRVLCSIGSADPAYTFVLGQDFGEYTHVQTIAEMAAHDHQFTWQNWGPGGAQGTVGGTFDPSYAYVNNTTTTGSSDAFNITQPISAIYLLIKL